MELDKNPKLDETVQNVAKNETNDMYIDLAEITWDNLTPEIFRQINQQLLVKQRQMKKNKPKEVRLTGNVTVKLRGSYYSIKTVDYQRLKSLKSEKSKQKMIDKIISENNKIDNI